MKKILLFLFFPIAAWAQPTITDGSNIVPAGNSFPAKFTTNADLGSIGADQTWDFSMLSFSNLSTLSIVDPASTSFSSSFPSANWSFIVGPWTSYFEFTTSEMNNLALNISSTGGAGDYSEDPRKVMVFPFNFQDSYSDTYTENSTPNSVTVTYEGYGTLIMPDGITYTNVIRVKEEESTGIVVTKFYTSAPFMNVLMHFSDNSILTWIVMSPTQGLEENELSQQVSPNPGNNEIRIDPAIAQDKDLSIYNINGSLVKTISSVELIQTNGVINIEKLTPGTYFLSGEDVKIQFVKL